MIHRYNRRTSINVDTEENDKTITTEKPQPLDSTTTRLSGDKDSRECERWKESL
jgi:hypothetical protein